MQTKNKNTVLSFRVSDEIAVAVDRDAEQKKITRTQWLENFFLPKFRKLLKKGVEVREAEKENVQTQI